MALQEVMFHTGVADVPSHVAKVAAKVVRSGETMTVLCAPHELDAIDAALWQLGKGSFLPHSRPDSSGPVQGFSPITLVTKLESLKGLETNRLVSTLHEWVAGCEAFDKLIEVVTPQGTVDARERWKRYAQLGVKLSNTALDKPTKAA